MYQPALWVGNLGTSVTEKLTTENIIICHKLIIFKILKYYQKLLQEQNIILNNWKTKDLFIIVYL